MKIPAARASATEVKRRIMLGHFVLSSGYYDAYYKRAKFTAASYRRMSLLRAFEACDLMMTPTSPSTAFQFGAKSSDPVKMYAADICTVNVNIAGLPGISVSLGVANGYAHRHADDRPKVLGQLLCCVLRPIMRRSAAASAPWQIWTN